MADSGTLYLVATPIGNLGDLSERALSILRSVDVIAAEDTRVTRKLSAHFSLSAPLVSYYEHNRFSQGEKLIERLLKGQSIALVSDAGTPAVSDPGEDLVRLCVQSAIPVVPIPGACAAICALIVSGLPTNRFSFEGFLPGGGARRRDRLLALRSETRTLIFYEAPHHLTETLDDLISHFGSSRRIALCKELTKKNEQVFRGTLAQARELFEQSNPRGEYVLVVAGKPEEAEPAFWESLSVREHLDSYRAQGYSQKDAVRAVAADRGVCKNEIYMQFVHKDDDDEA